MHQHRDPLVFFQELSEAVAAGATRTPEESDENQKQDNGENDTGDEFRTVTNDLGDAIELESNVVGVET
jgi:hypothetical protein